MARLKHLTVLFTLAGWFVTTRFFLTGSYLKLAFLLVVTAYSLAVLLFVLSVLAWRWRSEELTPWLGWKLLLCGPSALVVISSVTEMLYHLKYRNLCPNLADCMPLEIHVLNFLLLATRYAVEFYAIVGISVLFIRLMKTTEDFIRRR